MKLLVFSDTHGYTSVMDNAIKEHQKIGKIDMIVHLGDGMRDFAYIRDRYPAIPKLFVAGNCDSFGLSLFAKDELIHERTFELGGKKFLMAHGHLLNVKVSTTYAAEYAAKLGCDVVLYGHTHEAEDKTVTTTSGKQVRVINPGSANASFYSSYACIEIVGNDIVCGFGKGNV